MGFVLYSCSASLRNHNDIQLPRLAHTLVFTLACRQVQSSFLVVPFHCERAECALFVVVVVAFILIYGECSVFAWINSYFPFGIVLLRTVFHLRTDRNNASSPYEQRNPVNRSIGFECCSALVLLARPEVVPYRLVLFSVLRQIHVCISSRPRLSLRQADSTSDG